MTENGITAYSAFVFILLYFISILPKKAHAGGCIITTWLQK